MIVKTLLKLLQRDRGYDVLCSIHHARGDQLRDPDQFITRTVFMVNGEPVATLDFGPNISKNPLVGIHLDSLLQEDMVAVRWFDSAGNSGQVKNTVFELVRQES